MAELLDLGKHCYLNSCKKLDYTPFLCRTCTHFYCSEHRFLHGCDESRLYDPSNRHGKASTSLRPFLCTKEGCSNRESVKITCPICSKNYCLKHRHESQHTCRLVPSSSTLFRGATAQQVKKLNETLAPILLAERRASLQVPKNHEKAALTAAEQLRANRIAAMRNKLVANDQNVPATANTQRQTVDPNPMVDPSVFQLQKEDRIAVMKLKMASRPTSEQQILLIQWPEGRKPILVRKTWTVGRAVSEAVTSLKIPIEFGTFHKRGSEDALEFSEIVAQILADEDTVVLTPFSSFE